AVFRYCEPDSTCSAQSLRKRTPNTPSATTPRIATRSAIFGVKRHGSSTRGWCGRKRREETRGSAKQSHLLRLEPLERRQQPAHQRVYRSGQEQVEEQAREGPADGPGARRTAPPGRA